jgi:hypothetical protein
MSLLNNKNKTNIRHTIVGICENINVNILGNAQDIPSTELIRRVARLDASILWEEWTIKTVPTLGLGCYGELRIMGSYDKDRYVLKIEVTRQDGSITAYIITITFEKGVLDLFPGRSYQRTHVIGGVYIFSKFK